MKTIGNVQSQANAEVFAVASGALPNGKPVIVNSNGTVSVVSEATTSASLGSVANAPSGTAESATPRMIKVADDKLVFAYTDGDNDGHGVVAVASISGTTLSFGSEVTYYSGAGVSHVSITAVGNNKVVIVWTNAGSPFYSFGIVGTVSGTSISFGSAGSIQTNRARGLSVVTLEDDKVLAAYQDTDAGSYGASRVGTVSGTSISFGSEVIFKSVNVSELNAVAVSSTKVVIAYVDTGNSDHGTSIVGTVSGTSISYGSEVVFNAAGTGTYGIGLGYDSTLDRVLIAYGAAAGGVSIVGTVSGTSISYGSPVTFDSSATTKLSCANVSAGKIAITYADDGLNTAIGTVIVGTISGTSVSFNTGEVVYNAEGAYWGADAGNAKLLIGIRASNQAKGVVFQTAFSSTNLTSENFIGFTNAAYATGQTATIQAGGAVNSGQSSLTIGQQYFVQEDGTLGLTVDSTSVIAGTAVSATDLIVKG